MKENIFLPGTDKQLNLLLNKIDIDLSDILVVGSNSEEIAGSLKEKFPAEINLIIEDHESLLKSRLMLSEEKEISIKLMDFDITDFQDARFDLVYAQASVSNTRRNKIVKEIKRILKPGGIFCVGEIVYLKENPPAFVRDIFSSSDIIPLNINSVKKYYEERKFQIIYEENLSSSLKNFYLQSSRLLEANENSLSEQEKKYYKKLLKRLKHESNVYLKLGGDEFMGFKVVILKKGEG